MFTGPRKERLAMNRRSLGFLAIALIVLMAIIAVAGLDSLPRDLRGRVQAATASFAADRGRFEENRAAVERALTAEPDLFRAQAASWRQRLSTAQAKLGEADAKSAELRKLAEANRRDDREKVEKDLAGLESLRSGAIGESDHIRRDAERWLGYKRNLPQQLAAMKASYESLHAWDASTGTAAAQKAMIDWPAKSDDLKRRIDALSQLKNQAEGVWESTSATRSKAEAQDWAGVDYAALFAAGEQLQNSQKQITEGTAAVNTLAQQLYVDRNKVLVELEEDGRRQKVRVVETKFPDSTLNGGQASQQERWENVDEARFRELANNVGMVIERKPAGKYDSEAERAAQAPAYAYVAPPGQANQYGSWSNGVWQWLPQYLILSQLLRGSQHPPITSGDYLDYDRSRRRGETWYGRSGEYRQSWGRSASRRVLDSIARSTRDRGWYRERPRTEEPRGLGSGGYSGSKYQSRGSYSGSRYQSRGGGFGGFGSRSYSRGFGRGFGRGGRR
jgi:hypothetical protein